MEARLLLVSDDLFVFGGWIQAISRPQPVHTKN